MGGDNARRVAEYNFKEMKIILTKKNPIPPVEVRCRECGNPVSQYSNYKCNRCGEQIYFVMKGKEKNFK